jgi:hypothetical protein
VAIAAVGGACILAAGAGALVATRHNQPAATTAAPAPAATHAALAAPVQETEAVMDPAPPVAAPMKRPAAEPTVVERRPLDRPAARRESTQTPRRTARVPRPAKPESTAARSEAAHPAPVEAPDVRPSAAATPQFAENPQPSAPPAPVYDELTVPADSVIGLEIDSTVSTETAQVEDEVEARVARDVMADGRVAVPSGARALGTVTLVERGGKVKERARLGVRFHTLVLADGTTLPIQSETVYRDGESPAKSSTAKIGGAAVGGAILGGLLGGTRGAVIGGSVGAAGGTAATMAGSRRPATLPAGSTVTVRVLSPVTVNVER